MRHVSSNVNPKNGVLALGSPSEYNIEMHLDRSSQALYGLLLLLLSSGCSMVWPDRLMSREKESGAIVTDPQAPAIPESTIWYVLIPSLSAAYPQLAVWQVPDQTIDETIDSSWAYLAETAGLLVHDPSTRILHSSNSVATLPDKQLETSDTHTDEPPALSLLQRELQQLRHENGVNVCLDALSPSHPPGTLKYPSQDDTGSIPATECSLRILDSERVRAGQAAFIGQQMGWVTEQAGVNRPSSLEEQWKLFAQVLENTGAGTMRFMYADPNTNIIAIRGKPGLHEKLDRLLAYPPP